MRFVPHERLDVGLGESWGWVPDVVPLEGPDAWHPLDLLIALLHDDEGQLRGTMSIDLPTDGRRPGEAQRAVLQKYAEQAGRAVVTALEREEFAARVRLAEAARKIVRSASASAAFSVERIIADSRDALAEGFGAAGMWMQTFDEDGLGTGAIYSADGTIVSLPEDLVAIAERAARRAWAIQIVEIVSHERPFGPTIDEPRRATRILGFLGSLGIDSILFAPLGAGPGVPRQPRAHPAARGTGVDRRGGHHRPRHRPRPGPGDPQRPRLRARAPAGPGAAGARRVQEPADRHRLARAEEPAHLDRGPPGDPGEPSRRAGLDPQLAGRHGPGLAAPGPRWSRTCCCSARSATRTTR